MSLSFQIETGGGPPAGIYRAKFLTVEQTEHAEFGEGLKFCFEVTAGDNVGMLATRITGARPTPQNAAGRMISGISGTSLTAGVTIELDPFVGQDFLVQVEEAASGNGTRIASVMPADISD